MESVNQQKNIDDEIEKQNSDDGNYPIDDFKLAITPNDFNAITIKNFLERGVFKIPLFQRNYVWDIKRASKLIESLIVGIPIPQVFLYEKGKNEFLVIDGQQRLMTIYYFFSGRFPRKEKRTELRDIYDKHGKIPAEIINDDDYFQKFNLKLDGYTEDQENRFNSKNYETLGDYQSTFDLATIRNMVIKPLSEDDNHQAMFEIFNRLNTGGVNLSPQEIRMSMYSCSFIQSLIAMNRKPKWREIVGYETPSIRLSDVESILRLFAMSSFSHEYSGSVSGFLNKFSGFAKESFNDDDLIFLNEIWENFLSLSDSINIEDFKTGGNAYSITLLESAFYASTHEAITERDTTLVKPLTKEYIYKLKTNSTFKDFSTGKTTRRANVTGRLKIAKDMMES